MEIICSTQQLERETSQTNKWNHSMRRCLFRDKTSIPPYVFLYTQNIQTAL